MLVGEYFCINPMLFPSSDHYSIVLAYSNSWLVGTRWVEENGETFRDGEPRAAVFFDNGAFSSSTLFIIFLLNLLNLKGIMGY